MQKKLNIRYSASQFFYFTMYASMFAFVSVYLLDKGFDNTTIGFALSLTSLASIGFQMMIADFIGKNKEVELRTIISAISLLIMVASALMYVSANDSAILLLVILSFSLSQAITPLLNSVAFIYDEIGLQINYGFARGIGSLAYALITFFLGYIIEFTSPQCLPLFYFVFAFLLVLSIRSYRISEEEQLEWDFENHARKVRKKEVVSDKTLIEFIKEYEKLIFLMLGVVFLFYGHIIINNFFIQIITPIGGDSRTLGIAVFIGTLLELPAMMNFNQLARKIPVHHLLQISAVFFLIKHLLTYLAPNLWVIYLAQASQIGAFSVAYPALVEYTQTIIADEDLVRGQSLLASAIGLSNIFASLTGGILLDGIGVSKTMFIAVLTTVVGVVIVFITVEEQPFEATIDVHL